MKMLTKLLTSHKKPRYKAIFALFMAGSSPVTRTKTKTLKLQWLRGFFLLSQHIDRVFICTDSAPSAPMVPLQNSKNAN